VKRRIWQAVFEWVAAQWRTVAAVVWQRRQLLWNTFKYVLAFGLLAIVVWRNWGEPEDEQGLAYVWKRHVLEREPINYHFLALTTVIFGASVLLTIVRWYTLVRAQGLPFTLSGALRLGLIGFFFNIFLPGSVGGDIIKAAGIAREQSRRTVAVATVLIDRAIALWGLIWFVALLGAVFWAAGFLKGEVEAKLQAIVLIAAATVGVSLVVCLLLRLLPEHRAQRFAGRLERIPRVGHSAAEAWRAFWLYRCRPWSVVLALVISLIGHVGFVLTFYFAARTLKGPDQIPPWEQHFLIVPIGMVIQAIPLFPSGTGVGELGFGSLYKLLEKPAANGVLGSLVQRVVMWGLGVVGYLVYLRMRMASRVVREEPATDVGRGGSRLAEAGANRLTEPDSLVRAPITTQ
jgi:uncharacterized membrane protein YbhN (UPF0104 family)